MRGHPTPSRPRAARPSPGSSASSSWSRSPTSRSTRSAPRRPGSRGVEVGPSAAAVRRAAGARRASTATPTSRPSRARAARATARRARCAGPDIAQLLPARRAGPGRARVPRRPLGGVRAPDRRARARAPRLPGRRRSRRSRSAATATSCGAPIRTRGWTLPVAYDRDGGVANAYAVAVCPTITFAFRGGRVQGTSLATLDGTALRRRLDRLRGGCVSPEPDLVENEVDAELAREWPGLRLASMAFAARPGPAPPELRDRLRLLSDRFRGPQAIALRAAADPARLPRVLPPHRARARRAPDRRSRRSCWSA